jgi:GntR family transcriptional regulator
VAAQLSLSAGETVYEIKRTVVEGDEQLVLITSWLPARLFPGMPDLFLEASRQSTRALLRDCYGMEVVHQHKEISITMLDEAEARLLGCQPGSPALLITYLSRNAGGEPVEFRRWIVRGDRCKVFVDLETPELLV